MILESLIAAKINASVIAKLPQKQEYAIKRITKASDYTNSYKKVISKVYKSLLGFFKITDYF